MCYGCYEELGKPEIINESVLYLAGLIDKIYEYNCVGSNLHIVIDDWNLDDDSINFCLNAVMNRPYHQITEEQKELESECCELLLAASMDERASALALQNEYFVRKAPTHE